MSTVVFTNTINRVIAAPTVLNGATVGVILLREAPQFVDQDSRYLGSITLASLLANPGFVQGSTITDTEVLSLRSDGNNRYALWSVSNFTNLSSPEETKAAIIYYVGTLNSVVNPVLLVTNTPFSGGLRTVVTPADGITSNPDSTLSGSNRYILSWAVSGGVPVAGSFSGGPFALSKGPPAYEQSHAQHVWMLPQRANMISNPSFEAVGMNYWSGNGVLTRVAEPSPDGGAWAGRFDGDDAGYVNYVHQAGNTLSVPITTPADANFEWRIDMVRPPVPAPADQYRPSDTPFYAIFTDTGIVASFIASDATFPGTVSVTYATLAGAGFPAVGQRLHLRCVWNATTDTQTLYWRAGGLPLSDNTGWNTVVATAAAGKQLRTTDTPWVLNGSIATQAFTGRVYRWMLWYNTVLHRDVNLVTDFTDPAATTFTATTGQTVTVTRTGGTQLTLVPYSQSKVIAEANMFPTLGEEFWTINLMAKGTGRCKVGLVNWRDEFEATRTDWGSDEWNLSPTNWTHITTIRRPFDAAFAMLRVECLGGTPMTLDKVLVEKGTLKDWPYFDGTSTYGARDDFSWYGGAARQGATYSLWYNNRRSIYGRLFALDYGDDQIVTDADVARQGFVYQWVPAGTVVIPHIDVLYENDIQMVVPTKAAGVIAYRTDPIADVNLVENPWL